MVVTRRTSVPMPPTSRTPSNHETPKVNKGKATYPPSLVQELDESYLNGASPERSYVGPQFSDDALFSDGSPPRKVSRDRMKTKTKKRVSKTVAKRKKRSSSWLDLFSRMFILAFLIYSLSVCPTADKQASPVCRALSEYRRLILEPYVITPFQNLLHHPSVSPYTTPVIEKAQPIIARSKQEWNSRVVPQWQARVVPQWEKHVVPRYESYVSPQLTRMYAKLEPYRQQAIDIYSKHAAPYVERGQVLLHKAQPYVVLAGAKTYDTYQTSKPYLGRLYEELQRVPPLTVKYVIRPLVSARRQYVDPHVTLLLEKINELSSGTTKALSPEVDQTSVTPSSAVITQVTAEVEDTSISVEVELPVIPKPTSSDEALDSAASIASATLSLETDAKEASQQIAQTPSPEHSSISGTEASASSIISASLGRDDGAAESVPGATYSPGPRVDEEPWELVGGTGGSERESKIAPGNHDDVEETVAVQNVPSETVGTSKPESYVNDGQLILDVAVEDPKEVASADTAHGPDASLDINIPKVHRPPQPVAPPASSNSDDDLEELLAELELDVEETISTDVPPPAPSVVEETEEEKAVREAQHLAEVAAKRRELEDRHSKWEEKLAETIKTEAALLKDAIASIRRTGAAELKINLSIRTAIENLNTEGEKALRGTDAYFAKLKVGGKPRAEQARLWDRVLEKVQAKFDERVENVEEAVNKWYQEEILSKENQELEKASEAVRTVADDAQADIGLDYAWLDDVTYMDWRRYHALLDKHKEFQDESVALTNGSHESSYSNPVLEAFEDLQSEVRDITVGFETRMRRIKREGERAFAQEQAESEQAAPEVSVLPIADNGKKEEKVFQEVADAILGRSEEEVTEALNRAEGQRSNAAHEEL